MASSIVTPQVVKPKALNCPNCGGPVELRGFAHTLSVVCPQCLSVLDAATPEFQILQKFQGKQRDPAEDPAGNARQIRRHAVRSDRLPGARSTRPTDDFFCWDEYLLFNPYKGFRYLTEYQGHWNFVRVMSALPVRNRSAGKRAVLRAGPHLSPFRLA